MQRERERESLREREREREGGRGQIPAGPKPDLDSGSTGLGGTV